MVEMQFDIEYRVQIIEHPDSMERYMSVRSRQFVFRVLNQPDVTACMIAGDTISINHQTPIEIPSIEEHERIDYWSFEDRRYMTLLKNYLLGKVRRRIEAYLRAQINATNLIEH